MGVVYRARDDRLMREVALRVISPQQAADPTLRARLNRESTALASVDHPNVAPLYEAGERDGWLIIATRWVDGRNLSDLVAADGPLEAQRAVRIVNQVASALQAAHAAGIMHRAVRPTSVLVTGSDHAYLTDFDLARRASDLSGLTVQENLVEAFDFVAPEYIEGREPDQRVDIYGLGCVLYVALTGQVPYPRENATSKLYAHLHADPPSVRAVRPDLPEQLDRVVARALAKSPDDRQQTSAQLAVEAADAAGLPRPFWVTDTPEPRNAPIAIAAQIDSADRESTGSNGETRSAVPLGEESVLVAPVAHHTASAPAERAPAPVGTSNPPIEQSSAEPQPEGAAPAAPPRVSPVASGGPEDAATGHGYSTTHYYRHGRTLRSVPIVWVVALILFIAAPAALLIALLHG